MNRRAKSLLSPTMTVAFAIFGTVLALIPAQGLRRDVLAEAAVVPKPGELFRDCPDCAELVVVPAGDFEMGSAQAPYEKPQHRVTIASPFAVGRREVTFAEWDLCVAGGGCNYRADDQGWGRGDRPVIDVSWDDAKMFARWQAQRTGQAYRLPSEAEWEYAARAGSTSLYWWGPRSVMVGPTVRNAAAPRRGRPCLQGRFDPTRLGFMTLPAMRPSGSRTAGMNPIVVPLRTARLG